MSELSGSGQLSQASETGGTEAATLIERRNRNPEWDTTRLMVESMMPLFPAGPERAAFLVGLRCGMRRAMQIMGDRK